MVNCPNCGKAFEDGARFCNECGTKLPEAPVAPAAPAANVCPNCKTALNDDAAFCPVCGAPVAKPVQPDPVTPAPAEPVTSEAAEPVTSEAAEPAAEPAPVEEKVKKPFPVKPVIFGAIGVAVVAVVILLISLLAGSGSKLPDYAFYIKDKELFSHDFSKSGSKQVTVHMIDADDIENEELPHVSSAVQSYCSLSKDGKYIFFMDKVSDSPNLYYRLLGDAKKEPVKVDSEVETYAVNDAATAVTYLKNGSLYQYNMKKDDKNKLASDIDDFRVSDDGKKIIVVDEEGGLYALTVGKDKEKIASDIYSFRVSEDLGTVYYMKDGSLYKQIVGKDKEKIASDVYSLSYLSEDGVVYFLKQEDEEVPLSDYLYDDMKSADAKLEEPQYPYSSDYSSDEAYEKALEAYYEQSDEYYYKTERDALRESLAEYTINPGLCSLYRFDGKDAELLAENVFEYTLRFAGDADVMAFTALGEDPDKVNLSDIEYFWDVEYAVQDALRNSGKVFVASGNTVYEVDAADAENGIDNVYLSSDGKTLYFTSVTDEEKNECDLYKVALSKKSAGTPEKVDSEVFRYYIWRYDGSNLVYFKDLKDDHGELYLNCKKVDYDVYCWSVDYDSESGKLVYFTDYNEEKEYGTLKTFSGKKAEKVADDVHAFTLDPNGNLLYLADYSQKYSKGDLYLAKGTKSTKLDEDVVVILTISNAKYHSFFD